MTGPDNISRDHIPPDGLLPRLARVNPTAAFLGALVFMLVALFAPGIIGGGMLLALAAALIALTARTWPVQTPPTRMLRMTMLTLLVAIALMKIM